MTNSRRCSMCSQVMVVLDVTSPRGVAVDVAICRKCDRRQCKPCGHSEQDVFARECSNCGSGF